MRTAAKRLLGSKKKIKSRGVKIKLKIKAKSPEAMTTAVKKLSRGFKDVDGDTGS